MLYLLWAILNIGLFVYFLFVCFNVAKLVRERLGNIATVVFVFGLLSFMGGANHDDDSTQANSGRPKWQFNSPDSLAKGMHFSRQIELQKNLISTYKLWVFYGKDKQLQNFVPISAFSSAIGLQSGTSWKPKSIIVNSTDNGDRFQYSVLGEVEWKLLGMPVFHQSKEWEGVLVLQ